MHSQELIETIKTNLLSDPQKCIKTLSNKAFVNNLFLPHLQKLTNILESALQKMGKENKNISFNNVNQQKRNQQLNAQLIICFYSIIIMKSSSKSIIMSEQSPIYNQKLAIQTLNKIHKHAKEQDIKKIAAALLLKIPNFNAHKNIIKQLDPKFVSIITLQKASQSFRNQCPNLFEQKLNNYKQTNWGKFLSYKPFKLDDFREIVKKLQNFGSNGQIDANSLISIRQQLKNEYQFLIKRIQYIQKQEVFLYEYCQKMAQMFRIKLQFSKLLPNQKSSQDNQNNQSNLKSLPDYNINELKLKILLESRNYLLMILNSLIKRISSYWTRKMKWLYDFIIQRIQVYGLEEINTYTISEPQVYIQKFKQLKLTITLCHTYYKQFGDGLFPDQKLKGLLFTQQFSVFKMIEAILYNQYEFCWQHSNSRIVSYQKNKKVTEQNKNKQAVRNIVNINSKSLNINPHYDLVFQKVIQQITNKEGSSYPYLNSVISEALRFIKSYYKNSQTYFYGGNLITMIQNCKNTYILKHDSQQILKSIKEIIYSKRKMIKQGLQFFCEQFFEGYVSKRKSLLEEAPRRSTSSLNIQKTTYLTIHSHLNNEQLEQKSSHRVKLESNSKEQSNRNAIRKTKSYDMVFQGWGQPKQKQTKLPGYVLISNQQKSQKQESQLFYSIKKCSMKDQTQKDNKQQKEDISIRQNIAESKFQSIKQSLSAPQAENEELILTPQF